MGDICNSNDLDRFMRAKEGKARLRNIVRRLKGRTITNVTFSNAIHCILATLHLDDGKEFELYPPSLDVDALREEYAEVLEEEYYKDYPERRPERKSS